MKLKLLAGVLLIIGTVNSFPKKLLKVPKIYNALITTNEKLLPSEAFPASTGPVFQPIGLTGEPILLNPEAFRKNKDGVLETGVIGEEGETKQPQPLTFYPRFNVYHSYNPYYPYHTFPVHQEPIVNPFSNNQDQNNPQPQPEQDYQEPEVPEPQASLPLQPVMTYVKNNQPENSEIPDVAPPPPPVSFPRRAEPEEQES